MKRKTKHWIESVLSGFARNIIQKSNVKIIGITGSVGKSSAKEAIFDVLNNSKKYIGKVKKSEGNLNTEIGLPLAILGFKKSPDWYGWPYVLFLSIIRSYVPGFNPLENISILVLEYAADKPGDIQYLTSIAAPDIAVITKISSVHTEQFETIENIAKEKGILAERVQPDGAVFLNKDDVYSKSIAAKSQAKIKYFNDSGLQSYLVIATEVGKYLGVSEEEIKYSIKKIKLPPGRISIFHGVKETTIIDSTYNSSPEAVKEALKYLKKYKAKSRKIAILGDMRELGRLSEKFHREIADDIIKYADFAILIGPQMHEWTKPILVKNKFKVKSFENFSDAKPYISSLIEKGDIILVKGSQNTLYLERVVEMLLRDRKDISNLCRRGSKWDILRNNTL